MAGRSRKYTFPAAEGRRRIAEYRARKSAAVAVTDWITPSEAAMSALPVLFEQQFLGFENEYDKMVLDQGRVHDDWSRVYRLREERTAQIDWVLEKWLPKKALIEDNGLIRRSRLTQVLGEYAKYKSSALAAQVQDVLGVVRKANPPGAVDVAESNAAPIDDRLAEWIFAQHSRRMTYNALLKEAFNAKLGQFRKADFLTAYRKVYASEAHRAPATGWPLRSPYKERPKSL